MQKNNTTAHLHATIAHEDLSLRRDKALSQISAEPPADTPAPETEVFDEVQEQAMRAIMTLLDARGIPTCIKRGLADALEETAKIAGVNQRTIWTTNSGPGLEVNSKVLWEVFETPTIQDMWDLPQSSAVVPSNRTQDQTKPRFATVPIVGTVSDKGVELFSDVVDEAKLDERDRVQSEVNTILTLFDSPTPDFISDAVVSAIDDACEHFEVDKPAYAGESEQDRDALTHLFVKTKLFSNDEIKSDPVADLSWAISHIVKSPIAPERLRRSVGDFATDINELDESPEGIEKALGSGYCGYAGCPGSGDPLNPCPGPDAEGNHTAATEEDDDHVTVTLPNGEEVDLYGDAADMAKEKPSDVNLSLAKTLSELLNDPETPSDLFESVADFLTSASNTLGDKFYHSADYITKVLNSVPPEERMRSVRAEQEEKRAAS